MDSSLLLWLEALACLFLSSSMALSCLRRIDSCQLKYLKVSISFGVDVGGIIVHSVIALSAFSAIWVVIMSCVTPSGMVTVHGNSVGLLIAAEADVSENSTQTWRGILCGLSRALSTSIACPLSSSRLMSEFVLQSNGPSGGD